MNEKNFYKITFVIIVVLGTAASLMKSILYDESMNDWLSVISMTSGIMLIVRSRLDKKIIDIFMGIVFIILSIVLMLKYFSVL